MKNNIIEAGHAAQILGGRAVLSNIKDQYLEFWDRLQGCFIKCSLVYRNYVETERGCDDAIAFS